MKKLRFSGLIALAAAASLALAGCTSGGNGGGGTEGENGGGSERPTDPISIAYVAGWTDGQSMAYLLKDQLEKLDYEVELVDLVDNGPLYAGLSRGDIDISASSWPEVTQASFWEEYKDSLESLSTWYDGAVLTIAVPSYSKINSMAELKDNAALFGGEIIGIEPGAGLTDVTENKMMPAYELENDFNLVTSSTSAMLTVLGEALEKQQEIVVTLWRPFWAYNQYDVRDLADPLQAMGEPEGLHVLARGGFSADYAEIAQLISQLKLDDDAYGALEGLVTSDEFEGDPEGAVSAWIADHADAFPTLIS